VSDRDSRAGSAGAGIAAITVNARCNAGRHGQLIGARSRSLRPLDTSRAGIAASLRRRLPTVATAQQPPAAARVHQPRLCARVTRTVQAALALNTPEGMCANGPSLWSRMTSSTWA
jgi:hypothetical protein